MAKQPSNGDLRTPVYFYAVTSDDGIEPGEAPTLPVFMAWAQVYAASTKDNTILNTHDYTAGVTIKIRDTEGEFVPDPNLNSAYIDDVRYSKIEDWDIIDVRPDFEDDRFIVCVLGNPKAKVVDADAS